MSALKIFQSILQHFLLLRELVSHLCFDFKIP